MRIELYIAKSGMCNSKVDLCRFLAELLGSTLQKGCFNVGLYNFKVISYIEEREDRSLNLYWRVLTLPLHV